MSKKGRKPGRKPAARGKRKPSRATRSITGPAPAARRTAGGSGRRLTKRELRWVCPSLQSLVQEARRHEGPLAAADERERRRRRRAYRQAIAPQDFVGQDRALQALRLGLSLEAPGYNIFVAGAPGSGRRSLVRAAVSSMASPFPAPRDRVLVYDFRYRRPMMITLPRGKGRRFKKELEDLVERLRRALAKAYEGDGLQRRRERLGKKYESRERDATQKIVERASSQGFSIPDPIDGSVLFVIGRRRLEKARVEREIAEGEIRLRGKRKRFAEHAALTRELEEAQARARDQGKAAARALRQLDRGLVDRLCRGHLDDLRRDFPTEAVGRFADAYPAGVFEHLDAFLEDPDDDDESSALVYFSANLLVDARARGPDPMFARAELKSLFGGLESEVDGPDFLKARAGALLKAEGGALVLEARELFGDSSTWKALRRCLLEGQTPAPVELGLSGVPLATKIIIIGDDHEYHQHIECEDLGEIIKVKVELEASLSRERAGELGLAVRRAALRAGLRAPDGGALAALLEEAARDTSRQGHLSLRFGPLLDLIREAEALTEGKGELGREAIRAALKARRERHGLQERHTQALISDGIVLIDNAGSRVGQVNGLVVYENGEHAFARPCRITATVALGWRGIIDIEREASLSGESHHKGVQIISGLLRDRYAADKPLAVTASLCFEQSYTSIDGDSASAAEVLAILSALARVPIDQSIAISGSVNQLGDLQAVGGVNEKVEGFFDACAASGFNGRQGVIIPEANVADLALREDVIAAIAAKRFHVYAAESLDSALALLTGVEAGERGEDGRFPEGSIHRGVDDRLAGFAETWARFAERGGDPPR